MYKSFFSFKRKKMARSVASLVLAVIMLCSVTTTAFAGNTYGVGHNELGSFSFHGYNGGSYHTYNASKVQFTIEHKALDPEKGHYFLYVQLLQYGVEKPIASYTLTSGGASADKIGEFHKFTSATFSITPGRDYRFIYNAYDQGGYSAERYLKVNVSIDLSN